MMLTRLLFWFVVFYFLFKFIFRFVLPLLITAKNVRSKMKDMRQNMGEFEENSTSAYSNNTNNSYSKPETKTSSSNGDYIDFEEVK